MRVQVQQCPRPCKHFRRVMMNYGCRISRRDALLLGSFTAPSLWPADGSAAVAASSSCTMLDPAMAAAFMQAVYSTVQQQQVVSEQQLQKERYKLQEQEYKYFLAANKDRLPALPDLSDNSGGLSNRIYFNFVSYILWKAVARHLPTPEQRTVFCAGVGDQLLQQLMPGAQAALQAAARQAPTSSNNSISSTPCSPAAVVLPAIQQLLLLLQQGGYICSFQLVWDSQPGTWPADWPTSQAQLIDLEGVLQQQEPLAPGSIFQIKLQQPADIEASVALRSEEDGFWSRHVSSVLLALLRAAGYEPSVDEYFYQDYWSGPASTADKLLLLFGDPLQQVEVPWTPTTLVQNWTL